MNDYIFKKSTLNDVVLISPKTFCNEFGEFEKDYEKEIFKKNGIFFEVTEEYSIISDIGVIRGIHFQDPYPQSRLISVILGQAMVVIVDLRIESKNFGNWIKIFLEKEKPQIIYVPKGFGIGTLSMEKNTIINVKCYGNYYAESSTGIIYNDNDLNVSWFDENHLNIKISEKDKNLMTFLEYRNNKKAMKKKC